MDICVYVCLLSVISFVNGLCDYVYKLEFKHKKLMFNKGNFV